ncbi:Hypothetical protein R9X50_00353500 [Acrodontium crateriforme]|uniref:Fork-head domain-containing protein n=1 Tax=Acrodontium crateriforme TaxID=150365 RepID=A0AAQ3R9Y9_9PEZI|nr:Hypothetical protein R9X50_00353500 [Acrodontium crateriforme]
MSPSLMASTRRPHLQIYEDSDASLPAYTDNEVESALLDALRPLGDASNKQNVQLNPTTASGSASSPKKTDSSPLRPMTSKTLIDVKLPPPPRPNFVPGSPRKASNPLSQYHDAPPLPQHALYPNYASTRNANKENSYDPIPLNDLLRPGYPTSHFSDQGPIKRALDSSAMKDRSAKKMKIEKDEPFELPDPKDMPSVVDDGSKPSHSYAELIGMAILRAPNRRLTLAQIYKWISDNFAFYKTSETGWQNSIRHNLSLNKNFIKQERPKDDPGKGNYWAIKPGEERPYLQGKKNPVRRITNPDGSAYVPGLPSEMSGFRPSSAPAISNFTLAPNPGKKFESKSIDSAKFPNEADFSSDGTIPASDPALQEQDEDKDDSAAMPPPPSHFRSSPPPAEIGSSPPPMASINRKGTPPPVPRFPSTSRSGGRRQKFSALNDSGYWSSIESSAARGAAHQLTSEAGITRSRTRKGRAEEEIARIRSSSFDSPSRDKTQYQNRGPHFCSSSPLKDNPLTPAVVFQRPVRPPPSISPNTNLRNHRNRMRALLGSPAKTLSPLPEMANWSPAFNIMEDFGLGRTPVVSPLKSKRSPWKSFDDSDVKSVTYTSTFDVFIDAPEEPSHSRGSPEKRSARPSLARAATSTGILADITGAKSNGTTPTDEQHFSFSPFFSTKPGAFRSPNKFSSPLKQCHLPDSHSPTPPGAKVETSAEIFGADLPNSDGTEEGIDIFQDFGKIGQTNVTAHLPQSMVSNFMPLPAPDRANGSPVRKTMGPPLARPRLGMGRSLTSRW